jgi:type IV pilus assembly protein PilO
MHPVLESILSRPKSHKIAILVGTLALMTFVYWQYFYSPLAEEYKKAEEKVAELEKKIADEKRRVASLSKLKEAVRELEAKLKTVLQELPDNSGIDQLIDSISDKARDAGLEITLFNRKADILKDFYVEVPVAITVEGTYHQVATFFDEVSRLDRIVNINSIAIHNPKESPEQVTLTVDCIATAFRYMTQKERDAVAAAKEATGKSGKRR